MGWKRFRRSLIPTDVGRPISHIKPNIDCPDLGQLIGHVIDTVTPCERDVHDRQGKTLSLRIRPYKNLESRIDGAVLALFDTDGRAPEDRAARWTDEDLAGILETVGEPVLILGDGMPIEHLNGAFAAAFGVSAADGVGRRLYELSDGQWKIDRLRVLLEAELPKRSVVDDVEIEHHFAILGRKRIIVSARQMRDMRRGEASWC